MKLKKSKGKNIVLLGRNLMNKFYSWNKIQGYCPFAQKPYIFRILDTENKNEKNELEPATWEEYHCKNKILVYLV